jgi:hypothetical protein
MEWFQSFTPQLIEDSSPPSHELHLQTLYQHRLSLVVGRAAFKHTTVKLQSTMRSMPLTSTWRSGFWADSNSQTIIRPISCLLPRECEHRRKRPPLTCKSAKATPQKRKSASHPIPIPIPIQSSIADGRKN